MGVISYFGRVITDAVIIYYRAVLYLSFFSGLKKRVAFSDLFPTTLPVFVFFYFFYFVFISPFLFSPRFRPVYISFLFYFYFVLICPVALFPYLRFYRRSVKNSRFLYFRRARFFFQIVFFSLT